MATELKGAACAVLGAGGFIGTNLALGLEARGAEVRRLGRRPPTQAGGADDAGGWFDIALEDPQALMRALRGCRYVFHLVGGTNPARSMVDPEAELRETMATVRATLQAVRGAGAKIVFTSSGGTIYGPQPVQPITEEALPSPLNVYAAGKLLEENLFRIFGALDGTPVVGLRLANPYGPHQNSAKGQGIVGTIIHRALSGQPIQIWGDGSVVRDYVYIDDIVSALITAAGAPREIYNVGSGQGRSLLDVIHEIERALPDIAMKIEFREARPVDVPRNVLSAERFIEDTGWRPEVGWEDGIRRTVAWYRSRLV